jgi:hypothetical protein
MTATTIDRPAPFPPLISCPHCGAVHRFWRTVAKCRWRKAEWITGSGRYASVSYCPRGITVILFAERAAAEAARRGIDKWRCGGMCCGRHSVVDLGADYEAEAEQVRG